MSCLSLHTIDILKTLGVIKLSILDTNIKIIYTPSIPMLVNYFITKSFHEVEGEISNKVLNSLRNDGFTNPYTVSIANIASIQVSCLYQDTEATKVSNRFLKFNYPFVSSDYVALHDTSDTILYMNEDYADVFKEVKEKLSDIRLSDYILAFAFYINEYKLININSYYSSANALMNDHSLTNPVECGFYAKGKAPCILPAIYAAIFIQDLLVTNNVSVRQALLGDPISIPSLCGSSTKILNTMEVMLLATKDTAMIRGVAEYIDKLYREIVNISSKYGTLSFKSLDEDVRSILLNKFKSIHGDICYNI